VGHPLDALNVPARNIHEDPLVFEFTIGNFF